MSFIDQTFIGVGDKQITWQSDARRRLVCTVVTSSLTISLQRRRQRQVNTRRPLQESTMKQV